MKHAARLNTTIKDFSFLRSGSRVLGKHVIDSSGVGVVRRYVSRDASRRILAIFPKEIAAACLGVNYSHITALKPHIHTKEQCVINCYEHVEWHETVFYEGEVKTLDGETLDNGNDYFLVDRAPLEIVESFRANAGDVWLLNSRQPHAVLGNADKCHRQLVQVFISIPFETVIKCLSDAGLLESNHVG